MAGSRGGRRLRDLPAPHLEPAARGVPEIGKGDLVRVAERADVGFVLTSGAGLEPELFNQFPLAERASEALGLPRELMEIAERLAAAPSGMEQALVAALADGGYEAGPAGAVAAAMVLAQGGAPIWSATIRNAGRSAPSLSIVGRKFLPRRPYTQLVRRIRCAHPVAAIARSPSSFVAP